MAIRIAPKPEIDRFRSAGVLVMTNPEYGANPEWEATIKKTLGMTKNAHCSFVLSLWNYLNVYEPILLLVAN